ncbi:MAG: NADH-quinone oxidoreductase subunit NuoE [Rickettsiales bacterium]
MTAKYYYNPDIEPENFIFTDENLEKARYIIAKYPEGRQQSAVMPLLALAQKQNNNWLPKIAMDYIAGILGMPPVRVYEVASFYTMYNLEPVGKHCVQVCTTTPCWLRGSEEIVSMCKSRLGIEIGETTADGQFTLREVECLGACVNAPVCQVSSYGEEDNYYEDLTPESVSKLIDSLERGRPLKTGSQIGRNSSEPFGD